MRFCALNCCTERCCGDDMVLIVRGALVTEERLIGEPRPENPDRGLWKHYLPKIAGAISPVPSATGCPGSTR